MSIFSLITIIEVLWINTFTTYKSAKRRKSKFITALFVCIVSFVVVAVVYFITPIMSESINGNALFMLICFLYIIPLYYLFDKQLKHLIIVMSISLSYTMIAFAFSFRIVSMFHTQMVGLLVVIVQTLLFALTLPYYRSFVNNVLVNIVRNIDKKMINALLVISLSWFSIIFLANYIFTEGNSNLLELTVLFLIVVNLILSYKLFQKFVSVNIKAKELSLITKIDMLTQLKNRESLYEDIRQKMYSYQAFSIVFLDLDNFKSINDKYGHDAGDTYLLEFVKTVKAILNKNDGFYRLHGDEFVLLIDNQDIESFCKRLDKIKFKSHPHGLSFKGLSFGYSSFPTDSDDLSKLLYLADLKMYQRKKEKHRIKSSAF